MRIHRVRSPNFLRQAYGYLLDGPQELGLPPSTAPWWEVAKSSSIKPLFVAAYVTRAKAFFEADPAGQVCTLRNRSQSRPSCG